jgi:hypothetical protein
MSNETYLIGAAVAFLACQAVLVIALQRALRRTRDMNARVTHLGEAMGLLTETTETGFRALAAEVERLGRGPDSSRDPAASARMTNAARRGRSAQEIAADERVSEGEVRLRLHLAEQARTPVDTPDAASPKARKVRTDPKTPSAPAVSSSGPRRVRSGSNGSLRA